MLRSSIKCGFDVNVMVDAPAKQGGEYGLFILTSVLNLCVLRIIILF